MSIVDVQMEDLRRDYPEATADPRPDGTFVITVPKVSLPAGWSQSHTTVQFLAPVGFPLAQPDCFWTDDGLRLPNGVLPKNANAQTPPFGGPSKLWFSWHVSVWSGSRDTLRSYMATVRNRLARPE